MDCTEEVYKQNNLIYQSNSKDTLEDHAKVTEHFSSLPSLPSFPTSPLVPPHTLHFNCSNLDERKEDAQSIEEEKNIKQTALWEAMYEFSVYVYEYECY